TDGHTMTPPQNGTGAAREGGDCGATERHHCRQQSGAPAKLCAARTTALNAGAQDIMRIVRTRAARSGSGSPSLPPGESAHNPPHYVE
ncbi:hypothetical protein, partial [Escherichia coli]|uniref:hypothetical protein n=1 Tax=Escherichia coli TaxID=562 RepID=UPI001BFEBC9E